MGWKPRRPRPCPRPRRSPTAASLCSGPAGGPSPAARESRSGPSARPVAQAKPEEEKGRHGARVQAAPSRKTYHLPPEKPPGSCSHQGASHQGASHPLSNGNAQRQGNGAGSRGRCLKYVCQITVFASNYNYENGWEYIVSICMESSWGGNSGTAAWPTPGSGRQLLLPARPPGRWSELWTHAFASSGGKFGFCASVTMRPDMRDLWNITLIQYYEISLMQ